MQERGVINSWNKETKQFELKANWKRYPENMLFARAISDAVKFFCPDVFNTAVYVADEFDVEVDENETPVQSKQAKAPAPEYAAFEPVEPKPEPAPQPALQPTPKAEVPLSERIAKLQTAFNQRGVTNEQIGAYAHGALGKDSLSDLDANDLDGLVSIYKVIKQDPTTIDKYFI